VYRLISGLIERKNNLGYRSKPCFSYLGAYSNINTEVTTAIVDIKGKSKLFEHYRSLDLVIKLKHTNIEPARLPSY